MSRSASSDERAGAKSAAAEGDSASKRDRIAIDTLRCLAIDMVEAAQSGHPGAPMGQAPLAYVLWTRYLRTNPAEPDWPNRDRFVLSCGHASALLYGLLHLAGFDLSLDELRRFRQLGSKTPGHPEYGHAPGVETTTGPLGQGVGNGVGMAIAERLLADRFNRPEFPLFDHRTWVLASDGDLMEGVAAEACSLAGHLGLGKLKVLYDDNRITIDGTTDLSFSEDVSRRFEGLGWHTLRVEDGNDLDAIDAALAAACAETERPTLVQVRTHIGYGSPNKQDSASSHGAPLGADEVALTKQNLGWPLEPTFHVPEEARQAFAVVAERGRELAGNWTKLRRAYGKAHPEAARELDRRQAKELPAGLSDLLPRLEPSGGSLATRSASGKAINAVAPVLPELVGGSADLAGSNNTDIEGQPSFSRTSTGPNFHFGVREHGMGAVLNGIALSGLLRPYGGTFLIFSDYMRPSIRLAALMGLPVVYVFTHDSIFLGEDGPTHQPISQLMALRAMPQLVVLRPADGNETAAAWQIALSRSQGPTALVLSRQKLPVFAETQDRNTVARGAYTLRDAATGSLDLVLLASGSEVSLALDAAAELEAEGIGARVVSMPSWELFAAQPEAYRTTILPPDLPRLAIEAGATLGWERWLGTKGDVLGIDTFGASAPYQDLAKEFGFTAANVVARAKKLLG